MDAGCNTAVQRSSQQPDSRPTEVDTPGHCLQLVVHPAIHPRALPADIRFQLAVNPAIIIWALPAGLRVELVVQPTIHT